MKKSKNNLTRCAEFEDVVMPYAKQKRFLVVSECANTTMLCGNKILCVNYLN